MPFKDNDDLSDPEQGWSPERSKLLARDYLASLAEWLEFEAPRANGERKVATFTYSQVGVTRPAPSRDVLPRLAPRDSHPPHRHSVRFRPQAPLSFRCLAYFRWPA